MIKINLLESVTDRQAGAAVVVERKVSSPVSKLLLMTLAVTGLLVMVIGWDIVSTQMAKSAAEEELQRQKEIGAQLEIVMKEQRELEQRISNIDLRIQAIKNLRASQAGPSAVLEAMRERIAMVPVIYLESIEQKGDQLTIKGNSPDESAVTQFGRSLEFSSGLFSNLNIETQRKEIVGAQVAAPSGTEPPKAETVNFTIRCAYTPSKANPGGNSVALPANAPNAAQPAQNPPVAENSVQPAQAPPQVAKN